MPRVNDVVLQARRERAAARVLDDERLRMHLTDDEAEPVLNWALSWADDAARATATIPDDEAAMAEIDRRLERIREHVRALDRLIGQRLELDVTRLRQIIEGLARNVPAPQLAVRMDTLIACRHEADGAALAREIVSFLPRPG